MAATARKAGLRAVGDDEAAPPKSITQAAERGTQRELLVALRARISRTVEDPKCPPRDLASLSRRLIEIDRDIRTLDSADEGDDIGEAANTPDEEWPAR